MANLQIYTLLYCTVDGALLTEEAHITVSRNSHAQQVSTVAKGFAGMSPGAPMVEIDVTSAVPAADFEFDPGKFMQTLKVVEMGIVGPGGKVLQAKGFIISDSIKHAVNSESTLDFKWVGQFANWE